MRPRRSRDGPPGPCGPGNSRPSAPRAPPSSKGQGPAGARPGDGPQLGAPGSVAARCARPPAAPAHRDHQRPPPHGRCRQHGGIEGAAGQSRPRRPQARRGGRGNLEGSAHRQVRAGAAVGVSARSDDGRVERRTGPPEIGRGSGPQPDCPRRRNRSPRRAPAGRRAGGGRGPFWASGHSKHATPGHQAASRAGRTRKAGPQRPGTGAGRSSRQRAGEVFREERIPRPCPSSPPRAAPRGTDHQFRSRAAAPHPGRPRFTPNHERHHIQPRHSRGRKGQRGRPAAAGFAHPHAEWAEAGLGRQPAACQRGPGPVRAGAGSRGAFLRAACAEKGLLGRPFFSRRSPVSSKRRKHAREISRARDQEYVLGGPTPPCKQAHHTDPEGGRMHSPAESKFRGGAGVQDVGDSTGGPQASFELSKWPGGHTARPGPSRPSRARSGAPSATGGEGAVGRGRRRAGRRSAPAAGEQGAARGARPRPRFAEKTAAGPGPGRPGRAGHRRRSRPARPAL